MSITNLFGEMKKTNSAKDAENKEQSIPSKDTTQKVGLVEIFLPIFICAVVAIVGSRIIKKVL